MLIARDYQNNEYPLLATKIHTSELNGQDDLELRIPQQKNNNLDLLTIDKLWEFDYNNITYKAVNVKRQTRGHSFNLNVRAMPLFYWEFSKSIIHANFNGSMTAVACFTRLFEGTGYNFSLINPSPAVSWEGFGKGSSRLELFKRALERYNYEFYIEGRTIYLRHLIGNDTNFMYKYKLNASNVSSTTDATEYFTHIKGFGNFEEGEEDYFNNAKLKREFTHPLADIVGKWEGTPIVDGRVTQTSTMDAALIKAVEESLAVTIEGTLHDVRKIYNIAVPVKGDRVWLHDERINLEQEIRLHKIVTTYDEKDNIIACDVTFGSQSIRDRHKSNLSAMAQAISDLLDGKIELPYDILAPRAKEMLAKLMSVDTELVLDNGIFAVDPNNPNNIVGLNSAGWFISTDGGATAQTIATADGIVANSITSGELLTHLVRIVGTDGFMWMDGNEFVAMNPLDDKQFVRISPQTGLTVSKGSLNILSGNGENAVTVWDSAEGNAKLHADTVAGTAEQNAKDHADGVGGNLRNDLQMTSPLPNELELSANGITAYNNSNDRYARLDYRGLFIAGGAIQITREDAFVDSNGKEWGAWVQDGMSNDEIPVQRNMFMTSPAISRGPQRYHADSDEMQVNDFYSVETTYTKHDRKVLTYGVGISCHSKTVGEVRNITARFEIVDINTNEVLGSFQRYIYGGQDVAWETLPIDLGVPDFKTRKAFLVRLAKTTNTSNTIINLIINRVALDG